MDKFLVVINAGSSSIKFASYRWDLSASLSLDASGQIDGIGNRPCFSVKNANGDDLVGLGVPIGEIGDHKTAIQIICGWLLEHKADGNLSAVGHRVVHGGSRYSTPVFIDQSVLEELEKLIPLAPLHQPHNLEAIRAFQEIMPELPQVACFDTAFHCTQPDIAQRVALPRHFIDEGVRRYGFHGLSYEYINSVLPSLDPALEKAKVIVAHLGNGASLCAIQDGQSIATTMGFSPLDGLVMGTRCGSLDPGVLLYLMDAYGMDAKSLGHLLYYESGLLGVSGVSNDMRTLLASDDLYAREAVDLFVYRISREIGSLAAALKGLDTLVFTGGIGEHSAEIRAQVCRQVAWLGLELDVAANQSAKQRISTTNSSISAWVVETDENRMIALHTKQLLAES